MTLLYEQDFSFDQATGINPKKDANQKENTSGSIAPDTYLFGNMEWILSPTRGYYRDLTNEAEPYTLTEEAFLEPAYNASVEIQMSNAKPIIGHPTLITQTFSKLRDLPQQILSGMIASPTPVDEQTLQYAEAFISDLYEVTRSTPSTWIIPHITTEEAGEVSLEWWHNGKSLTIFVNPSGQIEYLRAWGPHIWNEMEEGIGPNVQVLQSIWQWLIA